MPKSLNIKSLSVDDLLKLRDELDRQIAARARGGSSIA